MGILELKEQIDIACKNNPQGYELQIGGMKSYMYRFELEQVMQNCRNIAYAIDTELAKPNLQAMEFDPTN